MENLTYDIMSPSPIPNTVVKKMYKDGVHLYYHIQAIEGYTLHDKVRDGADIDPITMEETKRLGYTTDYTTCGANYDFTPVEIVDENGNTFTAYGEREFAARMEAAFASTEEAGPKERKKSA